MSKIVLRNYNNDLSLFCLCHCLKSSRFDCRSLCILPEPPKSALVLKNPSNLKFHTMTSNEDYMQFLSIVQSHTWGIFIQDTAYFIVIQLSMTLCFIHTLQVHYAHAAANLNSGYSKYAKVARVHYFCTIALRTSRAVLTQAWASRRVDLRERRVDSFSKRVIIFCC